MRISLRCGPAHIAVYAVPLEAIVERADRQIVFVQRRATLIERSGTPASTPLIRSSAGSRAAIRAASDGRYDYLGRPGPPAGVIAAG